MSALLPAKSLRPAPFVPTQPRTGDYGAYIFRGANLLLKGRDGARYFESYGGQFDLNETISTAALTGTLNLTSGSKTIEGAGTSFLSELHLGQMVLCGAHLLVVDRLVDQDTFIAARAPTANVAGGTGTRLPVLFDMDKQRGTLLRGNAVKTDKGNVLCVGDGVLRMNGTALNASLTATRRSQIAVYDPATALYTIYTLGMNTPATPSAVGVAGGTKNMQAGLYSIRAVAARQATMGYNNPSPKVEVTIAVGQKIRITLNSAMDTARGQDGYKFYGTLITPQEGIQGPWYLIRKADFSTIVTTTDLGGTGAGTTYDVEWNDAELARDDVLTYNNDAPVDAEFLATVAGYPVYVSCQGQGYSASVTSTSPGPFVIPAKPNNIDAAPLEFAVPLSPPETIIGFVEALGKLYLPTTNRLQFAQFTGSDDFPVTARPFWKTGFQNPYQLLFVNGTLYGYSGGSPTRSIAEGDEGLEEHAWAADVAELTKGWTPHHVMVAHDPMNNAVCFFHVADSLNDSDYWITKVLPYMLDQGEWGLPIIIESTTQDMIVSGVATVNGRLEFLAGGRTLAGPIEVNTYRFDEVSGESISGYLAWGFSDDNEEQRAKVVKSARVTGRFMNASVGIFGYRASEDIPVAALEAGNASSLTGAIALPNSTVVSRTQQFQMNVKNLQGYTARVQFTWDGTGERVRIDECVLQAAVIGSRR